MRFWLIAALALLAALPLSAQGDKLNAATPEEVCSTGGRAGHFSKLGVGLCWEDAEKLRRYVSVWSPDHKAVLVVSSFGLDFFQNGTWTDGARGGGFDNYGWGEAIWSPDSRYLLITRGYLSGIFYRSFNVMVGSMDARYPLQWDTQCEDVRCHSGIDSLIRSDYMGRYPSSCASPWDINIWGLTWQEGSSQVVFIVQKTANYERCEKKYSHDTSGDFEAYVVSIPERRIIERVHREAAIQRWGHLMRWLSTGRVERVMNSSR